MTVALYCRVSTEEQAANGFSIDNQISRLSAYCESQGWSDFGFYIDDGYTGTNLDRPKMQAMMEDINQKRIDTVVVYKLDRLSRCQKDVLFLLEDLFEHHHVIFKSVTEPFDTSTPLGRAMVGILAVFGQLERDTIVERTKSGKGERTKQGLWYGGPVPFGYEWSYSAKQLQILPEQAILVQSAFQQFLQGRSYRSIGKWLSSQTRERHFENHKAVCYMLSNPIYSGKLNYHGKTISGTHEAIVSQDTYDSVQTEKGKRSSGQKEKGKYLLSHLLICGICTSPMIHVQTIDKRKQETKHRGYYVCAAKRKKSSHCVNKWYPDDELEDEVITYLGRLLIDIPITRSKESQNLCMYNDALQLKKRITLIDRKLRNWHRAFGEELDNAQIKHVKNQLEELEQAKSRIVKQLNELPSNEITMSEGNLIEDRILESYWPYLTNDERQSVLRTAVRSIVVNLQRPISISWNL